MRARYVPTTDLEALLDAQARGWKELGSETLKLEGTPLGMQLTAHIRTTWSERNIGAVERVSVSAAHDGQRLAFRFEWDAGQENRVVGDNDQFPDGAAVLLPSTPGSPIFMGAPGQAVNAWYWRANDEQGRNVVAEGLGTSRTVDVDLVQAQGTWKEGRWRVVLSRALRVDTTEPMAQLEPGAKTGFAVAVWDGSNSERAGIKAYSGPVWKELQLDAVPTARR